MNVIMVSAADQPEQYVRKIFELTDVGTIVHGNFNGGNMASAQREFISEVAKAGPCRQFPESAWNSMLYPEVVGAATVERHNDLVYERIVQQMEQYDVK